MCLLFSPREVFHQSISAMLKSITPPAVMKMVK
jgi:hypothetical protein